MIFVIVFHVLHELRIMRGDEFKRALEYLMIISKGIHIIFAKGNPINVGRN
jgi:hypothetical protein